MPRHRRETDTRRTRLRKREVDPERELLCVARTASAFLARSAEGERRASVPTLQHSPSIHSREATRPHARPRPHLLCFNVLPWSQRASRHDSIAMAGALWTATVRGRCAAARAGAAQIRALAPSIQFPHSVVVVLSARTARTAIQRLMDGAQSPRRIAPAMWSFKHCPARHNQVSGTAPAALLCSRRARAARRSRPTRRRSAHPSPSWS